MALAEGQSAGPRGSARFAVYFSIFLLWILLIFCYTGGVHGRGWFSGWKQWDARWHEQIWREGYAPSDPKMLAFPPGYAVTTGALTKIFSGSFLATGVVLNLFALFASAVLISEWFSQKFGVPGYLLFVFVLSAPATYFAFSTYSDLLFLLLLWVLLWVAISARGPHGNKILMAEVPLLLVLPWIRLTGYALASWLLARRMAALAVFASLALWLGLNRMIAGNAFYFLRAQELFAMPQGNFFQGLGDSLRHLGLDLQAGYVTSWLEFGFLPLFYLAALTAAAVWLAKRREGLLAVTILSILFLSYNQGFWRSVVRYDLPLTPVLCLPLLVACESRPGMKSYWGRAAFYALTAGQFSLQIYFARLFHSGAWAF